MLEKILLIIALSMSVSCFAESGSNKSRPLLEPNQQTHSSSSPSQQKQQPNSDSSTKNKDSQATQEHNTGPKPSMIDYCRNNPC
ncbi:MAG: hypothetical protein DYH15_10640 [Nitrosomonas sp. PRO4]|nr:hypothetical protein [Nitrosomonas sp. PRO4]